MPVQFLSDVERAALDAFPPSVDAGDLHHFIVTDADFAEIVNRRDGPGARLAAGLQLGAVRLLGFVPDDLGTAPGEVVEFVAGQVGDSVDDLASYSTRRHTISDHVTAAGQHLGFQRASRGDLKAVGDWLVDQALEHDQPLVLFRLACEHFRAQGLLRPGVTTVERLVATARDRAIDETWHRIADHLPKHRRDVLDRFIEVDPELGVAPVVWLTQTATSALPATIQAQLAKLHHARATGIGPDTVAGLNPNRVRHLAALGQRMTPQALRRAGPERRYQIVASTIVEARASLTDEILELFDTALGSAERRARRQADEAVRTNVSASSRSVQLFGRIGRLVLDDTIPDAELRARIFELVDRAQLDEAVDRAAELAQPGDSVTYLRTRFPQIRRYSPQIIDTFDFRAANPSDPLIAAIETLRELNTRGARRVPDSATSAFLPRAWKRHLEAESDRIDRRIWELGLLFEIRGALRGANLWVAESRRYQNPIEYLVNDHTWHRLRPDVPAETGIPLNGPDRLDELETELSSNVELLDQTLATDNPPVRVDHDRLVVSPLPANDDLDLDDIERDRIHDLLPQVDLVDVLVEVNAWTGYLDAFTHASGTSRRTDDHTARLLAVLVASGCNLGITNIARGSEFSADQLQWTQNWFLRHETVTEANTAIVNHQHQLPLAAVWGTGTLSSSDGQRFPFTVRNPTARAMRRYYTGTGATIYTWTSDQHTQYGTRLIPTTVREATYVLDAIFDNETDLDIEEHTTDTAGYTDLVFGLFDLVGLRFSPRIRDLADQRLWRLPATETGSSAGRLLKHRIRPERILDRWDDMLRVAATIRHGHTPASLLVARLQASARQNQLTQAIQEYGRIIKTISILRYLHNQDHRRRIHDQLNKGESLHALRRHLFFANLGRLQRRRPDDQDLQAQCLTLLTNAIVCWNTVYLGAAIDHLRTSGWQLDDATSRQLSPTIHEHVNVYGRYDFIGPAAPPPGQLRPLHT